MTLEKWTHEMQQKDQRLKIRKIELLAQYTWHYSLPWVCPKS